MKRTGKVVVSMLAVASTLALGVLGSCAGIDKISQKIKEKKCDHEEYQIVEVTEEATCVLEGERLLECVECGKTKTEKFVLEHTDEDSDGACDVCDAATIELVEAEVGELVLGNTYRLYRKQGDYGTTILFLNSDDCFCATGLDYNSTYSGYAFNSGPNYQLEGFDAIITDEYIELSFKQGTYSYVSTESGSVSDSISPVVIDENTSIKSLVASRVYRVVSIV